MEFVEYRVCSSRDAPRGSIGICRIGQENHFAMVVESSAIGRNSLLILSNNNLRITNSDFEFLIIPGAYIRPVVSRETVVFKDVTIHLGAVRFVQEKSKLIAPEGDWIKFVDIKSGETEAVHSHDAPITTNWDLVAPTPEGAMEVLLSYTSTTTNA